MVGLIGYMIHNKLGMTILGMSKILHGSIFTFRPMMVVQTLVSMEERHGRHNSTNLLRSYIKLKSMTNIRIGCTQGSKIIIPLLLHLVFLLTGFKTLDRAIL